MICNKPDDVGNAVVVQSVLDSHLQRGFHSRGGDIVEGTSLHVHVVADAAMTVLLLGNAVELEIYGMESSHLCFDRKIPLLGKANSVGGDMYAMEAPALRVPDCVQEYRRECCFSSREQNVNLALRFEGRCSFKQRRHILHIQ